MEKLTIGTVLQPITEGIEPFRLQAVQALPTRFVDRNQIRGTQDLQLGRDLGQLQIKGRRERMDRLIALD